MPIVKRNSRGALFTAAKIAGISVFTCVLCLMLPPLKAAQAAVSPAPVSPKAPASAASSSVSEANAPAPAQQIAARLKSAMQENPDTVGWLTVPGTTLNTPIVQTADNSYYLKHNFEKQPYWKGSPFLDYRDTEDPLKKNSIIYGHNMGDGTEFGELKQFENLSFLNAHPVLYFGTGGKDDYWKIFSVYITDVNLYYIQTDFGSDAEYAGFLDQMQKQSLFDTTVSVTPQDNILTLSTCTYEFKDARFVMQARLVHPGESLAVAPAVMNPKPASAHHPASS